MNEAGQAGRQHCIGSCGILRNSAEAWSSNMRAVCSVCRLQVPGHCSATLSAVQLRLTPGHTCRRSASGTGEQGQQPVSWRPLRHMHRKRAGESLDWRAPACAPAAPARPACCFHEAAATGHASFTDRGVPSTSSAVRGETGTAVRNPPSRTWPLAGGLLWKQEDVWVCLLFESFKAAALKKGSPAAVQQQGSRRWVGRGYGCIFKRLRQCSLPCKFRCGIAYPAAECMSHLASSCSHPPSTY